MRQTSAVKQIAQRFAHVRNSLNERARRLFVASEAVANGYGGISVVSRATGVARRTIGGGSTELQQIEGGWTPLWGSARVRRENLRLARKFNHAARLILGRTL